MSDPEPLPAQDPGRGLARDYGVGVVSFAAAPAPGVALPAADTLVIRRDASAQSEVVARFILRAPDAFTWSYALEAREAGVEGNAVEFDYEVLGLPVDSVAAGGEWVRVMYGVAAGAPPRRGWVQRVDGRTELRLWADELPAHPLFFAGGAESVAFYDRPAGSRVRLELARRGEAGGPPSDYRLEPLEADGRWLKVRVVTPDDACASDPVETRGAVVWIEYLDARGRPRVWYHTRGC